ncbi:MAG: GAF domain-containing protein [Verrucomicrobiae bacterium]|nr:GAF domain-containing protein [Verrucomicrobiae bacterium]
MITPDPQLSEHAPAIERALALAAAAISPEDFCSLIGDPGQTALRMVMESLSADSISVWIADIDDKFLVVTHSEPDPTFIGWTQPLTEGLISLVYASEQPLCENQVYLNARHSKRVDEAMKQVTTALVAVPFYFGGKVQGVISCVQLKASADAPDPSGFTARGLNRVRRLSTVLERLVNYRLLTRILNLEL